MARDNVFLGMGRGKIGDLVLYRTGGQQVTRARNRAPKNPRTPIQLLQRVIMHTASSAYSIFKPLADHSFQGYQQGTPNQSRFMSLNAAQMRDQVAAAAVTAGVDIADAAFLLDSELTNFASKGIAGAVFRPWIIADGTLSPIPVGWSGTPFVVLPSTELATMTYADLAQNLNLSIGDQITFVWLYSDFSPATVDFFITDMRYSRVILEPAEGDPNTVLAFATASGALLTINSPNPRNEGLIYTTAYAPTSGSGGMRAFNTLSEATESYPATHHAVGFAVIASRRVGNQWLRSRTQIVLESPTETPYDYNEYELGDAIRSYMTEQQSSLYLNQATGF